MQGIDISSYEKGLKLKNDINFVILRAGFTGWGGDGTNKYIDETFEDFYKQCKDLNLPVGCYWFSCANTYEKGKSEGEYLYNNCLKGKQFEYPIYIDVEDTHHQKNNKRGVTDAIKGFCEFLENKGYYVGIYGSDISTFQEMIYIDELKNYDKWVARYGSKPKYVKDYQMWQYSSEGSYNGYTVDLNVCNYNYPKIIKNAKLNGFTDNNVIVNELDKYSDEELAQMVWQGKFGNGDERKIQLGDRYNAVQNLVNQGVGKLKSIDEIAKEVINGKWKNYPERKTLLENAGYNYSEVQKRVNEMLR